MNPQSNSSGQRLAFGRKLSEAYQFLRMRIEGYSKLESIAHQYIDMVEDYQRTFARYSIAKKPMRRVLEIGYGARPNRLIALQSMGFDAYGIDLDRPVLDGTLAEFVQVFRRNGFERCIKSLVRHAFFDRAERAAMARALRSRGYEFRIEPERFLVGNAAELTVNDGAYDLIVSEDVFEHIPKADLELVIGKMARLLDPHGVAIVRPCIYTGITGGHCVEWYPHLVDANINRKSKPWDHLRENRYPANCYLNRLTRAETHALLSRHFAIVEETVKYPDLGRQFLTPEVHNELAAYSDDELFSNNVKYVLRRATELT
jgi:hypothetical protein